MKRKAQKKLAAKPLPPPKGVSSPKAKSKGKGHRKKVSMDGWRAPSSKQWWFDLQQYNSSGVYVD